MSDTSVKTAELEIVKQLNTTPLYSLSPTQHMAAKSRSVGLMWLSGWRFLRRKNSPCLCGPFESHWRAVWKYHWRELRQHLYCRDKSLLVASNIFLPRKNNNFCWDKYLLRQTKQNKTNKQKSFVATMLVEPKHVFGRDKTILWRET